MPTAPPRACIRCGKPAPKGKPCQCRPAWDGSTRPGSDRRWRGLRDAKLRVNPICEWPGCRHPATQVDHIIPNAEDPSKRYEWANLQSLCDPHHAQKTAVDARRGKTRAR